MGQALKSICENFYPIPKKTWRRKSQISPVFRRPAVNRKRVTSKRLNISTNKNYGMFHLR